MLKQEFEDRTKIKVSDEEYESINEVYNNSDVDKDEFCAAWVRINRKRVNAYILAERERENRMKFMDRLRDMLFAYRYRHSFITPAVEVMSKKDVKFCTDNGMSIFYDNRHREFSTTISDVTGWIESKLESMRQ